MEDDFCRILRQESGQDWSIFFKGKIREFYLRQDSANEYWTITTSTSGAIQAQKVIICPGAFLFHLKERPEALGRIDMRPRAAVCARIRVDDFKLRQKLSSMPSVFYSSEKSKTEDGKDPGLHFYMLAPVAYPDGKFPKFRFWRDLSWVLFAKECPFRNKSQKNFARMSPEPQSISKITKGLNPL